ncbi:MAG TPA: lantibiotic dehydratase [Hymenobacter sp.]|jgi:thiopeptide-type bacteriocin biosynthesis protein|uniref:lantibiotic dehydratase n=1 Tax=Hymenobacter sp. TaxID=1898978 RepID=UPI002ED7C637
MRTSLTSLDFYLLRLPALPVSGLLRLHAHREPAALAQALHVLYQSPEIQEAIYLASPELYQELRKWLSKPVAGDGAQDERLLLTLYKYMLRMSSRSTPYGLFAGFSTGSIGTAATQLQLAAGSGRAHKHARLDMNYVAEVTRQVAAEPTLKAQLKLFINTSLYKKEQTYRYYEYRMRNKRRHYYLIALKASPYLDQVLAAAQVGATPAQLQALLGTAGVAEDRAESYVTQLVAAQVLVSELDPTVTGPEFYQCLVAKVAALSPAHPQLGPLQEIDALLGAAQTGVPTYQAVQAIVRESFPAATSKDLIQTDLRLDMTHNSLSQSAVGELTQELNELADLYRVGVPPDLQAFIKRFVERYEGQEVPLLEVLDGEAGLGYGPIAGSKANHTPFVDGVRVPRKPGTPQVSWTAYRQLVFRKFQERPVNSTAPVVLTEQDLTALVAATKPTQLPATLFAMGSFLAPDAAALDRGEFKFQLVNFAGPGAMPLLARFAHADAGLAAQLQACGAQEQAAAGEALLAEVVHLPEARVGNILQRPQLRAYEIPFLGQASVPLDQQLPVGDLLVSVQQGCVVLRSKRLNRVVQPRLTSAHNYRNGLAIYRFLCDLQQQTEPFNVLWDWGQLGTQSFLPRVEYKRIIVRRAQWLLPAEAHDEVAALCTPAGLAAFRERYQLPGRVILAEGDNELLLDFDCPLAVTLLAQRLKKGAALLTEFVQCPASQLLTDGQGESYLHEVIIPLARAGAAVPAPAPVQAAAAEPAVQRSFALGSEWTYLKVYCGAKWGDKLLTDHLRPCLEEFEAQHIVQKWFFIRYNDPHNHLRLRLLHDGSPAKVAAIIAGLHQALAGLQQAGVVQTIQYDTYHRELERYGAATMEFSETVFHHDSRAVVQFLDLLEGDEGERYRWLFALRGVDEMLSAFGLAPAAKLTLAEQLYHSFFQEFNGNADLTHQLNDKYRAVSRELAGFLDCAQDTAYTEDAVAVFAARGTALAAAYAALPAAPARAAQKLLPNYLHMFLNRIFLANQRLHELVVYHYLSKHYKSVAARQKTVSRAELAYQ